MEIWREFLRTDETKFLSPEINVEDAMQNKGQVVRSLRMTDVLTVQKLNRLHHINEFFP